MFNGSILFLNTNQSYNINCEQLYEYCSKTMFYLVVFTYKRFSGYFIFIYFFMGDRMKNDQMYKNMYFIKRIKRKNTVLI